MAVAVKTPPGTRSSGTLAGPAIISLIGVLYLLGSLGIVFKLLPSLWWPAWEGAGLTRFAFVGGTLLILLSLTAGVALLYLAGKLLGPNPPEGVRAGVLVAFVGLLIVVGLARWASLWLEYWSYYDRFLNPQTGAIVVGVIAAALLVGWVYLFTRPAAQKWVLVLEHGGWFHATSYKHNQGQKVRRGTIFGILLLVGAGIYTLVSHGTLRKGDPDLTVSIPFTGAVAIEGYGDTDKPPLREAYLADKDKERVQVRLSGETNLLPKKIVSFKEFATAVDGLLKDQPFPGGELDELKKAESEPLVYLEKLNELIYDRMKQLLDLHVFREDVVRRLNEIDSRTSMADLSELIDAFKAEADKAKKTEELGPIFQVPTGLLVLDRFALRDINDKTATTEYVKIDVKGDSPFEEGQIVNRADFDKEVSKLQEKKKEGRDRDLPKEQPLTPAHGPVVFASVVLLPSVQFTLPLLLLAVSLWLAWRVVNMPTFADFLIATEAELNKVSWTTQKRLVQDTIVVLVTVVLMAVFLFAMDWGWKEILSREFIGVLHIPKEQSDQTKRIDQKRW
jgi:preprotein translocase SecE subunit